MRVRIVKKKYCYWDGKTKQILMGLTLNGTSGMKSSIIDNPFIETFTAFNKDVIVGWGIIVPKGTDWSFDDPCVMIYVRRSCRKNGIGRKIFNRIVKYNKKFITHGWNYEADIFFSKVKKEIKRNDKKLQMLIH